MKNRSVARYMFLVCSLACILLTACSYSTNFVVVNASDHSVEVQYILKKPDYPIPPDKLLNLIPAIKDVSELQQQVPWRDLSASQYTFDPDKRKVVVSLKPGQALRIENRRQVDREVTDAQQAAAFSIEEIAVTGTNGEILLKGEQVRKSFVAESKDLSTLTYH